MTHMSARWHRSTEWAWGSRRKGGGGGAGAGRITRSLTATFGRALACPPSAHLGPGSGTVAESERLPVHVSMQHRVVTEGDAGHRVKRSCELDEHGLIWVALRVSRLDHGRGHVLGDLDARSVTGIFVGAGEEVLDPRVPPGSG